MNWTEQLPAESRTFLFRTPTRCQNGHFRFLFYSIAFGQSVETEWEARDPNVCQCPTGDIGEGYSKVGAEQQFTGLLDGSGKKVFEDDVIWHTKYQDVYTVVWMNEASGFFLKAKHQTLALSGLCQQYLQIVGNIYQPSDQKVEDSGAFAQTTFKVTK